MSTYTIGEIAERSGLSASTLRYYEGIGLVEPTDRTAAGYRVYDDHSISRLAFIARAKQLGCSLEEIVDLADVWDGERCGSVQRRFHELVTAKIHETERQIDGLNGLLADFRWLPSISIPSRSTGLAMWTVLASPWLRSPGRSSSPVVAEHEPA